MQHVWYFWEHISSIRKKFEQSKPFIEKAHSGARKELELPTFPPRNQRGLLCRDCGNECQIEENGKGYLAWLSMKKES